MDHFPFLESWVYCRIERVEFLEQSFIAVVSIVVCLTLKWQAGVSSLGGSRRCPLFARRNPYSTLAAIATRASIPAITATAILVGHIAFISLLFGQMNNSIRIKGPNVTQTSITAFPTIGILPAIPAAAPIST
jgi:hypothetical protein